MTWQEFKRYLFPDDEKDPAFREELDSFSTVGLRVIAVIAVGANVLGYVLWMFWLTPLPASLVVADLLGLAVVAAGLTVSYWRGARRYARLIGLVFLFVVSLIQLGFAVQDPTLPFDPDLFATFLLSALLLMAIASLALKPIHTLALGFVITISYALMTSSPFQAELELEDLYPLFMMTMFTMVSAALTAVVYQRRAAVFHSRRAAEQTNARIDAKPVRQCSFHDREHERG